MTLNSLYKTLQFFVLVLITNVSLQASANLSDEVAAFFGSVNATAKYRYSLITPEDREPFLAFSRSAEPEGIPTENKLPVWFDNLIARAALPNYFTCVLVRDLEGQIVAAHGLGIMPIIGYDPQKHMAIIQTFIEWGVIQSRQSADAQSASAGAAAAEAAENLEPIENRGITFITPFIPGLSKSEDSPEALTKKFSTFPEIVGESIGVVTNYVRFLKENRHNNPRDGSVPHVLMTLIHPSSPSRSFFQSNGFTILENPGYREFYNKDRVIGWMPLS